MKEQVLDTIFELNRQGTHYTKIAEQLSLSIGHVSRLLSYLQFGTEEEAKDLLVHLKVNTYDLCELIAITDFAVENSFTVVQFSMTYKIEFNKASALLNARKAAGKSLDANDFKNFAWGKHIEVSKYALSQKYLSKHIIDVNGVIVGGATQLSDQEYAECLPAERIMGRAYAVPRYYLPPKIMRRKDIAEEKLHQKKLQEAISSANAQATDQSKLSKAKVLLLPDIDSLGIPAASLFDANGKYIPKKGRPQFINPSSDGFDKLPDNVQKRSLRMAFDMKAVQEQLKDQLTAEELKQTDSRYLVAREIISQEKFCLSPTMIYKLCGIGHDNVRFIEERLNRPDKYEQVYPHMQQIYALHNGHIGRIRMAIELRKQGYYFCAKTCAKLMAAKGLVYISPKSNAKYSSFEGQHHICENKLQRDFTAEYKYEKIVTDVTEFKSKDSKGYLSIFKDIKTKEIVGYSIATTPNTNFVLAGFGQFCHDLPTDRPVMIHSDQGCQYQSSEYVSELARRGIVQSMSRKGNCYDNGACESFFGRLKTEVYLNPKDSYETNAKKIVSYINFYNKHRVSAVLGGLSPSAYARSLKLV